MKQYDIIVRSEFYVPTIIEELPTYIYELTDGRLVLRNGVPVMLAQKFSSMEPIASVLREDSSLVLTTVHEHIGDDIVLKELAPGTVLGKVVWPLEVNSSTLSSQSAKILTTGILKAESDALRLLPRDATASIGYHSKIKNRIILTEGSLASHSENFASFGSRTRLTSSIRNVLLAITGAAPQRVVLASESASVSPVVLPDCNSDRMRMSHSPITMSRGFNAIGTDVMLLHSPSVFPVVDGFISGGQTAILQEENVSEIAEKYLSAPSGMTIRCSEVDVLCGRPRHLYEMDDKALSEFDSLSMEQVDYITINE